MNERAQHERVRERFTRTAEEFGRFSTTVRAADAERLVRLVAPRGNERALDLACGPGTFTRAFAPHVRHIVGLDLTAAFLVQARAALAQRGVNNVAWVAGAGEALPFADASLDLVVFAYSVHHFTEPRAPLGEIRRVLRPRGRLALVDLIIPGAAEAALSERHNAIERARDASHACTLFAAEVRQAAQSAGLRIVAEEQAERLRSFDDWMQIAGWQRGDAAYAETRRLMEASIAGDAAGFHARHAGDDLEFVQTSLFLKAEKREAR